MEVHEARPETFIAKVLVGGRLDEGDLGRKGHPEFGIGHVAVGRVDPVEKGQRLAVHQWSRAVEDVVGGSHEDPGAQIGSGRHPPRLVDVGGNVPRGVAVVAGACHERKEAVVIEIAVHDRRSDRIKRSHFGVVG